MRDQALRTALDALPVPAYIFAYSEQRYFAANAAFCELIGYSEEELIASPWQNTVSEEDIAAAEEAQKLAAIGAFPTMPIEWRFKRRDGQTIAGTAKVRDMRLIGNEGRQVSAHFVVLISVRGEEDPKPATAIF